MALNIAVCIKVSPDPEKYGQIRPNPQTNTLIRKGIDSVIKTADLHAIEQALSLKEKTGGKITLFSMGRTQVQNNCGKHWDMAVMRRYC